MARTSRSLGDAGEPELGKLVASTLQKILGDLLESPRAADEYAGAAFIACERAARERPDEFSFSAETGRLESFLTPIVRETLKAERGESFNGGWMGTFVGPDGRAIDPDGGSGPDPDGLEMSRRALKKAFSMAVGEGNETMVRNLNWYRARLSHRTYEAIAQAEGRPPGTIRTGVARARKLVLRAVHELQHAQPAPLNGDAPEEIEPLRRLWAEQALDELARGLETTREKFRDDPHWLNLAALLEADRGQYDQAALLYEKALVFADAPSVRGRILNNFGNLAEEQERLEAAQQRWLRASQLASSAPAPLLNLLAAASVERNYASAQHYISKLSDLLSSGKLSDTERGYVSRRLCENPSFGWLRQTEAWRLGPARWIRAQSQVSAGVRVGAAVALVAALLLGFLVAFAPDVRTGSVVRDVAQRLTDEPAPAQGQLVAGDSMGKSSGPPRRPGRRQGA